LVARNPFNGRFVSTKIFGVDVMGDNTSTIEIASVLGLAAYVLIGGFWNGFYGHILLAKGYDVSSNVTIMLMVLNTTCNAFNNIPNAPQSASLCYASYSAIQSSVSLSDFFATILPILSFIIAVVILSSSLAPNSPEVAVVGLVVAIILSVVLNSIGYTIGFELLGGYATIPSHTTSTTSTSTSTTTSTSTSTTTIPPYTGCPTEPLTAGNVPLKCRNPAPIKPNLISFNLSLDVDATPIYNVNLACTTHVQQPSPTQYYSLLPNGMPDLARYSNGTTLWYNQTINVKYWPCDSNTTGSFKGYIWINFTPNVGMHVVNRNPWETYRAFDIYINEVLSSSAYNQTKNAN
jgi:hypothetical protein